MASLEARFTREAYEKVKSELDGLKAQRNEVRNDIKEAREQGDLRENFAYHQAKEAQGILEARITQLEARLDNAVILEEGEALDEVVLGVPVKVRQEDTQQERFYNIVSSEDVYTVDNGASEESPVGSALLGKRPGDVVEVQGPNGVVRFEILAIG